MSRVSKASVEETSGARFRQVLAEVGSATTRADEPDDDERDPPAFAAHPLAGLIFSFDIDHSRATGGGSQWDAALAWIEEADEPGPVLEPKRARADTAEAILAELGLRDDLSLEELNRLRRLYMWRNHPDRCDEAEREGATRRVAIANMLLDRAQSLRIGRRGI